MLAGLCTLGANTVLLDAWRRQTPAHTKGRIEAAAGDGTLPRWCLTVETPSWRGGQTQCAAASALTALAHGEEMNSLQMLRAQLLPVLLTALPSAELDLQVCNPHLRHSLPRSGGTMGTVRAEVTRMKGQGSHRLPRGIKMSWPLFDVVARHR